MLRHRIGFLMLLVALIAVSIKGLLTYQQWRRWEARRAAMSGLGVFVRPTAFTEPELIAALSDP